MDTSIKGADLHSEDGSMFGTVYVEVDNPPHRQGHEGGAEGEERDGSGAEGASACRLRRLPRYLSIRTSLS